jgi:septin 7
MLIRTHMEELKEHTQNVLYERYRSAKLVSMGVTQDQTVFKEIKLVPGVCHASWLIGRYSPAAKMAEERAAHEMKLAKMEAEMKMVFQQKVQEKEAKLKLSEEELYARHKEMKEACVPSPFPWMRLKRPYRLNAQQSDLISKKTRIESGRPPSPDRTQKNKKGFLRN